jgi:coatomer subunit beta'
VPSRVSEVIGAWKEKLVAEGQPKAAQSLADPKQYPNLFPEWEDLLKSEQFLASQSGFMPARAASQATVNFLNCR